MPPPKSPSAESRPSTRLASVTVGSVAAAAVAGGARNGAGAFGPDLHQPIAVEPGDGAAAGADRIDVDAGEPGGIALDPALIRHVGVAVADQADVGAGAAHVEGDDVRGIGELGRVDGADDAGRGPREGRSDRQLAGPGGRHQSARRLVDAEAGGGCCLSNRGLEGGHVAGHHRLQVGVQHRGQEALILAELGLHLRGDGDRQVGQGVAQRLLDAPLVVRIDEGEQEADGTGLGPAGDDRAGQPVDLCIRHLQPYRAVRQHPFRHLEPVLARHQGGRIVLLEVEHVGTDLPADLQEVAEALGGDQQDLAAAALDQGVRGDRAAVRETRDLPEVDALTLGHGLEALQDRAGGIVRCRRGLVHREGTACIVEGVEIGEGAADIDPDDPGHSRSPLTCLAVRSCSSGGDRPA